MTPISINNAFSAAFLALLCAAYCWLLRRRAAGAGAR